MDVTQVFTIISVAAANIGTTIALFVWASNRTDEFRKETNNRTDEFRKETNAQIIAIQQEIKDFHGRLCAIEERRNKILMGEK